LSLVGSDPKHRKHAQPAWRPPRLPTPSFSCWPLVPASPGPASRAPSPWHQHSARRASDDISPKGVRFPTCNEGRFDVSRVLFGRASKTALRAAVSRARRAWGANFGLEPCGALFVFSPCQSALLQTGKGGPATCHTLEGRCHACGKKSARPCGTPRRRAGRCR
jgi:hypothetical protein